MKGKSSSKGSKAPVWSKASDFLAASVSDAINQSQQTVLATNKKSGDFSQEIERLSKELKQDVKKIRIPPSKVYTPAPCLEDIKFGEAVLSKELEITSCLEESISEELERARKLEEALKLVKKRRLECGKNDNTQKKLHAHLANSEKPYPQKISYTSAISATSDKLKTTLAQEISTNIKNWDIDSKKFASKLSRKT